MNGWQRMFVVLAAIVVVPTLALWWSAKPKLDGTSYAYGCYESQISYVSIKDADTYLRTVPGLTFECKKSLAFIASGQQHAADEKEWRSNFRDGATIIVIGLVAFYALAGQWAGFGAGSSPRSPNPIGQVIDKMGSGGLGF